MHDSWVGKSKFGSQQLVILGASIQIKMPHWFMKHLFSESDTET